jgi:branched-chain amino acid transport system permease protein
VAGIACEIVLYRPLRRRGAPPLMWFLASFALLMVAQNVLLLIFGAVPVTLGTGAPVMVRLGGLQLSLLNVSKLVAGTAVVAFVMALLKFAAIGRELRAIMSHAEMARLVGIDLDRCYLWAYALGSALTVPAAAIALYDQGVSPALGDTPLLIATVGVFAGGLGTFMGGAVGGFALGLVASIVIYWVPAAFQQTIALGVLTTYLLWRPDGILGVKLRRV